MLTLIDAPRCPYCARVRIVLAEKGIEHETVVVDLGNRPPWLHEKNPAGKVPVLDEDGRALPESAVINEYLEERFPEPALLPAGLVARAAARLLIFRHDDFTDPYYAFRRGEEGADVRLAAALAELDRILAESAYLTGEAFGLVDVSYLPWVIRARDLLDVSLAPYPSLDSWLRRVSERPSVAAELEVVAAL